MRCRSSPAKFSTASPLEGDAKNADFYVVGLHRAGLDEGKQTGGNDTYVATSIGVGSRICVTVQLLVQQCERQCTGNNWNTPLFVTHSKKN